MPDLALQFLDFDVSDGVDGTLTLQAVAATAIERHAAVLDEVAQVLAWARRQFPHGPGPIEEGLDWLDDLQVTVEAGQWQVVTLTLAASPRFAAAFASALGTPDD